MRKRDEPGTFAPSMVREGVVLLHGIGRSHRWMWKLETALQPAGFTTLNLRYASRKKPLEELATDIHQAIAAFSEQVRGPIHFVGHSLGGLLTRVYIAKYRPPHLGRVVMLGTPNGGSEVADRLHHLAMYRAYYGPAGQQLTTSPHVALTSLPALDYEVGIIAGSRSILPVSTFFMLPKPNDGLVSVRSSGLAGMADRIVINVSHPGLLHSALAIRQTVAFLRDGRFEALDEMPSNRRRSWRVRGEGAPTAERNVA